MRHSTLSHGTGVSVCVLGRVVYACVCVCFCIGMCKCVSSVCVLCRCVCVCKCVLTIACCLMRPSTLWHGTGVCVQMCRCVNVCMRMWCVDICVGVCVCGV